MAATGRLSVMWAVLGGMGLGAALVSGLSALSAWLTGGLVLLALSPLVLAWRGMERGDEPVLSSPGQRFVTAEPDASTALFTELEDLVSAGVHTIDGEIARALQLTHESVGVLTRSLHAMASLSERQQQIVTEVLQRSELATVAGESSVQGFAKEVTALMDNFIHLLISGSQQSVATVHNIDDMVEQVDGIFGVIDEVKGLSKKTALLALNASIEAARAGEAGKGFGVVADEVRKLAQASETVNDRIRERIQGAQQAIERVRDMVSQMAARDMNDSIAARTHVASLLSNVEEMNHLFAERAGEVSHISTELEQVVGNTIRSLQFEDIARQSLGAARDHTELLRNLGASLKSGAAGASADGLVGLLQVVRKFRSEHADLVNGGAVSQTSMKAGEIELF